MNYFAFRTLACLLVLGFHVGVSQTSQYSNTLTVPNYIPPSPDAASLGKFADIPVGTYTGIPEITVPLYTIKSRDISLPLSLSYHASGIRVEEEASWVGLGWTLNAGGAITRTVRGNDDFSRGPYRGYIYSNPIPEQPSLTGRNRSGPGPFDQNAHPENYLYLTGVAYQEIDGQPDVFYFNLMGHTGKFFLAQKAHTTDPVKVVLLSNNENLQISYDESALQWTVLTNDGFKFILGTVEYTKSYSFPLLQNGLPSNYPYIEDYAFMNDERGLGNRVDDPTNCASSITAWYLDKIISPSNEVITFSYTPLLTSLEYLTNYATKSTVSINESRTDVRGVGGRWSFDPSCDYQMSVNSQSNTVDLLSNVSSASGPVCLAESPPPLNCGTPVQYYGSMNVTLNRYLTDIKFSNGSVHFTAGARRDFDYFSDTHFPHLIGFPPPARRQFALPLKLDKIEIIGAQSYKAFDLNYGYFNNGNQNDFKVKRLRLNSVTEISLQGAKKPYVFTYYGDGVPGLSTNISLPSKYSKARDFWGYYNGKDLNSTLIPQVVFKNLTLGYVPSKGKINITAEEGAVQSIAGGDRKANETYAVAGTLKNIKYPTGGSTDFEFESNQFNLEEGATEIKDILVTSQISSFEVPTATNVKVTAELNCPNQCGYGQSNTPCTVVDDSQPYIELRNEKGVALWAAYYHDFLMPQDVNLSKTQCGVVRTFPYLTLPKGKYSLVAIPLYGFDPHGSVNYSIEVPVDPSNLVRQGGGIRVKSIVDHDGIDPANDVIRKFDYTWTDALGRKLSTGKLMTTPMHSYFSYNTTQSTSGALSSCFTIISDSYSNLPLGNSARGNLVGYDQVTVSYGANGENGKSVFYYMNSADEIIQSPQESFFPNSPTLTHSPSNGQLLRQVDYTGNGKKIRETINSYTLRGEASQRLTGFLVRTFGPINQPGSAIQYHWYYEPSEWWHLSGSYQIDYDVNDPANVRGTSSFARYYFENPAHKFMTKKQTLSSEGETMIEQWQYPLDVTGAPPEIWDNSNPHFKNQQNLLINHSITTNNIFTSGEKNDYQYLPDQNVVVLNTIQKGRRDGTYEPRITIEPFDRWGNPLSVSKINDSKTSYLWGYKGTLPIAQAVNAQSSQLFFEGFEENGMPDKQARSGVKSFTGKYTFAQPPGFYPDPNSTLSYWYFEGGTWKYKALPYSGGSFALTDGEKIDDVRICPAEVKMTTYTYDPLVGITSVTDPNGQTTYYLYDELSRLKAIKDFKGNVVKRFDYQYKE